MPAHNIDSNELIVIDGDTIQDLLQHQEIQIVEAIQQAYENHQRGKTVLPHSMFLRFPDNVKDRIIALPAFLGGEEETAGLKWVSSFPGNVERGIERASAVLILNSMATGRPAAVLEASLINAKRTAASAALATRFLAPENFTQLGLVGCGPIGFEIVRFIRATHPQLAELFVFDLDPVKAAAFASRSEQAFPGLRAHVSGSLREVGEHVQVLALSTTARDPYILDEADFGQASLVLNISLRDIAASLVLSSDNIVDDVDHVSREGTSIHLAELETGNRDFVRGTIGALTLGELPAKAAPGVRTIYSPFGLGILDLALGRFVLARALETGRGTPLKFFPAPWNGDGEARSAATA